ARRLGRRAGRGARCGGAGPAVVPRDDLRRCADPLRRPRRPGHDRGDHRRSPGGAADPSVRDTLRFFEHVNGRVADDPRVALIIDDGARYLRRASETYDVITLEPPPPRAPGASSLY